MKPSDTLLRLLLASSLLTGCDIPPVAPEHDPYFSFPAGSRIELLRPVTIPADKASISFQHGQLMYSSPDQYTANCRLILKAITPVSHTIQAGSFYITGVKRDEGLGTSLLFGIAQPYWVEYETIFRLSSAEQPEVYSMICRHVEEAVDGRHLTLQQMRETLSGIISIKLP